jgi:hypothetical protein
MGRGLVSTRDDCYGREVGEALAPLGKEKGVDMTRLLAAWIALLALALATGTATAASGGATVEEVDASFSISSTETNGVPGGCSFLPDGLVITWEGTLKSVTVIQVDRNGIVTVQNQSNASGKATDQNGNTYAFSYSNHFRVTQTAPESGLFSGKMTDHFSLAGHGVTLSNGFVAQFTTNFVDVFEFEPSQSRGDPLDFETGAPHCDPL